jgi:hypothetical protein
MFTATSEGAMPMGSIWVGVDVGKTHHHVAAVDDAGKLVLS